ncbi:ankyrin repeat and fibronectin type-III domain-containing protein [Elysia marginata]|uniref:Ankyrin repeat and fibronectin type-III domain-containing protein n=1 Tax=Elysia marginata TaxID=1093978 RepID=A0AAV4ESS0_9GAST|nr:ankyrin repeat and fibronectin type-III domain-containing protein [Elysia marginata]
MPRITPSPSLSSISTAVSSTSSSSSSYANHPTVTVDHVSTDTKEKTVSRDATGDTSDRISNPMPKAVVRRSYSADLEESSQSFSTSSSSCQQQHPPPHHHQQNAEPPDNAIVKVHAMYETGLRRNVNIKLHISEQTTSRDIVNLVVRHLNSVVQRKGKGAFAYPDDALQSFCLVLIFQDGRKKVLSNEDTPLSLGDQLHRARVCVTILEPVLARRLERGGGVVSGQEDDEEDDGLGQATIV